MTARPPRPPADRVAATMRFNATMQEAGIFVGLDGLHPPSMGARVGFPAGKPAVTHAPFPGMAEALGGYGMIHVASRDEAIAWASRRPASENETIAIRQVEEMADFPAAVRRAAASVAEMQPGGATAAAR